MLDFGMYSFGWYKIEEQFEEGWTATNGNPLGTFIFYHSAEVNSEKWFGNIEIPEPETSDLIIYKYKDLDGDGEYVDDEPMFPGVEFTIEDSDGNIYTGTTNVDGEIHLTDLEIGIYTVTEIIPEGWMSTTGAVQDVTIDAGETAELWFGNNIEEQQCQTETAWGGNTAGGGTAWWFYYDDSVGGEQTIWAGQTIDVGTVEVSDGTVSITLTGGWELLNDDEAVKIQGYDEGELPDERPPAGQFEYKGTDLTVSIGCYNYYAIHLDVQLCQ